MSKRVFRAAGIAAATIGMLSVVAVADASTTTASCSADGHNNNANATFSTSGSYHVWASATYKLTGNGTGGKSNEIIRLRANGADKWAYDSPDDRRNGVSYTKSMDSTRTLASATEYVLFRAIFDVSGGDPSCNAYTPNL